MGKVYVNVKLAPWQNVVPAKVGALRAIALTVRLDVLLGLVTEGFEPTTWIKYPEPAGVATGIVTGMVPAAVAVTEPIVVGDAKLPEELDNCAVKTLPA